MAVDQDVAGELGRYADLLEKALAGVRQSLGLVRADMRIETIEAELLTGLTAEEQAALEPFLQRKNLAELRQQRDLLVVQRDALVKAIDLVRAKLNG